MWTKLLKTTDDYGLTILRIGLGLILLPHGLQKVFGWFGGGGWSGTTAYFSENLGVPAALTALVILGESAGALGLITGTLTRVAAAGLVLTQIGAIAMVHLSHGFFMNWSGTQAGEGVEYALLAIAMGVVLVLRGGGPVSVDRLVSAR